MTSSRKASKKMTLPGPDDIFRRQLPNGITILCRENPENLSIITHGYIQAGGIFDPTEKLGLANFTSFALMRGTEKHALQQLYDLLETNGASLSFGASIHTTSFSGRSLAEDLPLLLGLTGEILRLPVFPPDQIEILRAQLLTGLALREQDTEEMASLTFDKLLYREHPYARPVDGWQDTIREISREDLIRFQKRHYGPGGMVISIVGAIDPINAAEEVEKVLGDWENPSQPAQPELSSISPLHRTQTEKLAIPDKFQSNLVIGTLGPSRFDPDYLAASLGNSILGQFGMMGRIGKIVRQKSGLAYSASSSLNSGIGPGSWEVSAGVNPLNVEKAIQLICKEISRFVDKGVKPRELSDSKAYFIGRLPLSLETNAGVASALVNLERFKLGLDYYLHYSDILQAVTTNKVKETAQRFLNPDALAIAIAGPK